MAQTVKNLTTVQETRVQSLGQEDPLEKEMATHSSILAWRVPRTEEPGGLQSMVSQRVGHNSVIALSLFTFVIVRVRVYLSMSGNKAVLGRWEVLPGGIKNQEDLVL